MGERRLTILVVDDEEPVRDLVGEILRNEGYHVECASDGEEALSACYRLQPHVVVLDVMMPKENGYRVAKAMKSCSDLSPTGTAPAILLLTGRRLDPERESILMEFCMADAVLYKPFANADLVRHVRGLVRDAVERGALAEASSCESSPSE